MMQADPYVEYRQIEVKVEIRSRLDLMGGVAIPGTNSETKYALSNSKKHPPSSTSKSYALQKVHKES